MANFFKKLTGSFKVSDEDEFLNDATPSPKNEGDDTQDDGDEESTQVTAEDKNETTEESKKEIEKKDEGEIDKTEMSDLKQGEYENDATKITTEETMPGDSEDDETTDENEEEDLSPLAPSILEAIPEDNEGLGEQEKPFTIAQLAKATTARKLTSKSKKKRLPKIKIHTEKSSGNQSIDQLESPEGQLAIDVYETPDEIVIKSTIAGVSPEDIDVGIEDNTINIRGARYNEETIKNEDYFYQECYWGAFSRSVILPSEVDNDQIKATLTNGVLTIRLPKIKREKEKKIKVIG